MISKEVLDMQVLRLKEFRIKADMSQREIAVALNISQPYYWSWEQGQSMPDAKQILQLCEIFNCTPNDLFGIKGVHMVAVSDLKDIK